jgi:diguanylate cyclase (GGDEF)-like protein/PAS domain S-box-containing protein
MSSLHRHKLGTLSVQVCLAMLLMLLMQVSASGNNDPGMLNPRSDFAGSLHDSAPYGKIAIGLALALIPAAMAIRFFRLSAALKRAIAESERINSSLRESEVLYRSILNASPEGITVTDMEGRIRKASPTALAMFRIEREEDALGHSIIEYIVPEEHARVMTNMGMMLQGAITGPNDYRAIRADGSEFDFEVKGDFIRGANGQPCSMVFIGRDVTHRKQAKEALEESNRLLASLSITDALTGLANRRRFDEVLAHEHARHARSGAQLSLIMLDIDHFKAFNDSYGHVIGDDCLQRIAGVIAGCAARAADLPARYGGEEFACILPETDQAGAIASAEKIRLGIIALAIPHNSSGIADRVTASLGVVTITCDAGKPVSDIVVLGDQMLYRAKSLGRNRVESDAPD